MKIGGKALVKQEYIDRTHTFFEKYGTKAIIMARFVPIVRTFTPFVAGVGRMNYKKFLPYDIAGGFLWIASMSLAGYALGQNPWVKKHFEAVVVGIIFLSILPMIITWLRHRFQESRNKLTSDRRRFPVSAGRRRCRIFRRVTWNRLPA